MPGWAACHGNQPSQASDAVGTAKQIEDAHKAFDVLNIPPGCLAERAQRAARELGRFVAVAEAHTGGCR